MKMSREDVYIHGENTIFNLNKRYLIALIPMILFGFYKNGILVFQKNYTNILGLFKPLLIPTFGFLIGYITIVIYNKIKNKDNEILNDYVFPIQTLIIGMLMPINIKYSVFILCLTTISLLYMLFVYNRKIKINYIAVTSLTLIIISYLIGNYKDIISLFMNNYESSVLLNHSIYRLIFGFNYGGIASSNIILVIIAYFYLSFSFSYKKNIPFYLMIMFSIIIIFSLISGINFSNLLRNILNSTMIFSLFFVVNDNFASPYTNLAIIVYSLLLAITTTILTTLNFQLSLLIGTVLTSFIVPILNKVFKKTKFKQNKGN